MARNIREAAERLKNADPEEIQLIAKHDWDMIRHVAAFAFAATVEPPAGGERFDSPFEPGIPQAPQRIIPMTEYVRVDANGKRECKYCGQYWYEDPREETHLEDCVNRENGSEGRCSTSTKRRRAAPTKLRGIMMAELEDIIAKLEATTGPNYALECELFKLVHGREPRRSTFEQYEPSERVPSYTGSIDAALTLVPKGEDWALDNLHEGDAEEWHTASVGEAFAESRAGAAIAICIAALKARAAPTTHT